MHSLVTGLGALALLLCVATVLCAEIPPMPPLKTFHLDVPVVQDGEATAAIVTRDDAESGALGEELASLIADATGVRLPCVTEMPAQGDGRNLVIIGKFDDPATEYLYRNHFILTDARFPGPDGYVVRTVHDPFGDGRSVVFLGGSDLAGQKQAVQAFAAMLPKGRTCIVPHTVKVVINGQEAVPLTEGQIKATVDQCNASQMRNASDIICAAALKYHRTGDPGQVEVFKQGVDHVARQLAGMERVDDSRGIFTLPTVWDMIEESPVLSDEDRARISQFVWEYANKCPNANMTVEVAPTPHGNDWNARANLWAAIYYRRYYDIDVAGLEAWCDNWFAANMASWKPAEDCPGYGSITWYDTMCYMLERPKFREYLESGNLRKMADYAMMITNNLGYASGFGDISSFTSAAHIPGLLLITAWLENDGRYLWFYDKTPGLNGGDYFGNSYFVDGIEPVRPDDLLGVNTFELPDWVYEHRESVLGTAPGSLNPVLDADPLPEYGKCFDKVSFREGFDPDDAYLLLGGISHGYHAHPDGNGIICYTDNGKYWLFDNGYFVPDTIEHNTVCVFRDGLFEPVPRLTSLAGKADHPKLGMTRTQCAGYNGVNWSRNIVWRKGEYFAVLDELQAEQDADFNFQCVWRTIGDIELTPDRMLVEQSGERFCLISPAMPSMKTTGVTPASAQRSALIQTTGTELKSGQTAVLPNLFYSPEGEGYPYDAVAMGSNAMVVRGPEGHAVISAGTLEVDSLKAECQLAWVSPGECSLLNATALVWVDRLFESAAAVNINYDPDSGRLEVTAGAETKVKWLSDEGLMEKTLSPGTHELQAATRIESVELERALSGLFDNLARERDRRVAATQADETRVLEPLWTADQTVTLEREIVRAVGGDGTEAAVNLAQTGRPMHWEAASSGSSAASATDGNTETYAAVTSRAPNANDVPKDIGVEWSSPQTVSQVWVHHYDMSYRPAEDGQDLQAWDGEKWVSIDDEVTGADTPLWGHTFKPVETTRIRLLITKFNTMRTAIREFQVFAQPVEKARVQVQQKRPPRKLATFDLDGDGINEIAASTGSGIALYTGAGKKLWETDLGDDVVAVDMGVLDEPAIVASTDNNRMHCLDVLGQIKWAITSPEDKYYDWIEPFAGYFTVLKIGDIDGDGDGEIVAGNTNWFAYAFDHEGNELWGSLNWAHPALSIALGDIKGDGKLAAFIGTRYNDAGLFDHTGKKIDGLGMGYHSCPCATELADLDGDGIMELIGGSRIGGVHAKALGGAELWSLFMGAEVRATTAVDVTGDGLPEIIAASRNCYVICIDQAGKILWKHNAGDAVSSVAFADLNGDGAPEIVAGVEDGTVHVLSAEGKLIALLRTGGSVTQVLTADIDGSGRPKIIAGSEDSKLYVAGL